MSENQEIKAFFTDKYIRVYQAFNDAIANSALHNKKFVTPPFKTTRTTWIKPSFLWMMYRSGWATKENQTRILAIDITHQGFSWALQHACLSHFDSTVYSDYENWSEIKRNSPVIVQWDPARDLLLNKLTSRSIQIGLTPQVVNKYVEQWILDISDATETAKKIKSLIDMNKLDEAHSLLPTERAYSI